MKSLSVGKGRLTLALMLIAGFAMPASICLAQADTAKSAVSTKAAAKVDRVKVKLPGMTWGGCAASVRSDLGSISGISDIKTDVATNLCSFKTDASVDATKVLNKLAKTSKHIKGWSYDSKLVSLNLPGMTWGGCAASVRSDLKKIKGITDIKTDVAARSCSFKADSSVNAKKTLNKLAKTNSKIKGWSFKKKAAKKKAAKNKLVSIKLPGMTWGGCAASVRSDMNKLAGISEIKTDVSSNTCTFKADATVDTKKMLNRLAKTNDKVKGWSVNK